MHTSRATVANCSHTDTWREAQTTRRAATSPTQDPQRTWKLHGQFGEKTDGPVHFERTLVSSWLTWSGTSSMDAIEHWGHDLCEQRCSTRSLISRRCDDLWQRENGEEKLCSSQNTGLHHVPAGLHNLWQPKKKMDFSIVENHCRCSSHMCIYFSNYVLHQYCSSDPGWFCNRVFDILFIPCLRTIQTVFSFPVYQEISLEKKNSNIFGQFLGGITSQFCKTEVHCSNFAAHSYVFHFHICFYCSDRKKCVHWCIV